MKISHIRITPLAFKDPPLLNAIGVHGPYALRSVLQVTGDNGLQGLGETYGDPATVTLLEQIAPRLIGLDVFDLRSVHSIVTDCVRTLGQTADDSCVLAPETDPTRTLSVAYAAFEVALLDLQARSVGLPLADFLGGRVRDRVPFSGYLFFKYARHVEGLYADDRWGELLDAEQLVGAAERMVEQYGFGSLKLKGGVLEPARELECMRALRQRFPQLPLRIDPNGNWSVPVALRVAQESAGLLEYLEDPCPTLEQMAEVHRETGALLATNMVVTRMDQFRDNAATQGAQVILADHHYWGGLRETQALARMCEVFGWGLSMHSNSHLGISLMAMAHVAASIPNLSYACDTHYPWLDPNEQVVQGGHIRFDRGAIAIGDRPGLGVEIDEQRLQALHRQYLEAGSVGRDDAAQMRKYDPNWEGRVPRFA